MTCREGNQQVRVCQHLSFAGDRTVNPGTQWTGTSPRVPGRTTEPRSRGSWIYWTSKTLQGSGFSTKSRVEFNIIANSVDLDRLHLNFCLTDLMYTWYVN